MAKTERWLKDFESWLQPFLDELENRKQTRWAPVYLHGLMSPGARKSVQPMAERSAPGHSQQLHHFISAAGWAVEPLRSVLWKKLDALLGGSDATLTVDDTALPKKGDRSVGVSHQYCGQLGKQANCQSLVSLTLTRGEVPAPLSLELFLPESWDQDAERRAACKIPDDIRHRPKWKIALEEIGRVVKAGVRFGMVNADAEYGSCSEFRKGLGAMGLKWALGLLSNQMVYPAGVEMNPPPTTKRGRPAKHPEPSEPAVAARDALEALPAKAWKSVRWRAGTKGDLRGRFVAVRVRPADGDKLSRHRRAPGDETWLVGEWRRGGEKKYYLSNLPATARLIELARAIKSRWACEQAHQQMKEELGLGHFECRSWPALRHHTLMVMIAMAYLQSRRLEGEKKTATPGSSAPTEPARTSGGTHPSRHPDTLPTLPFADNCPTTLKVTK